jgi:D-arabinose 1-dehydrogenase-like Zn-dependent alcohol dehydrogenase
MKGTVAFIPGEHKIEFHEFDVPAPPPGGLIAEVTQTNVCGSEVHMWRGEFGGRHGIAPGHEMAGRIRDLGDGVKTDWAGVPVKAGDRIAPVYYSVCNRCSNCVAGNQAACTNKGFGVRHPSEAPHFTSTFATHYIVRANQNFYRIPDNVPDLVAASANCAMSQVYWGLDKARVRYGESLVVLGAGGLGLHAMAIAKARGAYVVAIDGVEHRLDEAMKFGADATIDLRKYGASDARQKRIRELIGGPPDVVIEVAGVPEAFIDALELASIGGRVIEIGNISPGLTAPIAPWRVTFKSLEIIGVVMYPPNYLKKSLDFLAMHIDRYPYRELCDATFPLSKAAEALDKSERREVTRAALLPQQG